jgi:hypothetical protein
MGLYKNKINPRTGQFNLVPTNQALTWRAAVASQANLPLSGNVLYDARLVSDTQHLYIWSKDDATGLLTDWIDQGDLFDLTWAAISGKPSSAVVDIDDAVSKRHNAVTAGDGISVAGQIVSNSDRGSTAVTAHKDLTTGVHGVGVGTIAKVSDISNDSNLSVAAQAAISASHSHSNKATLDLIQEALTTALKNKLDGIEASAVALATVKLDVDIADSIAKKHTQGTDSDLLIFSVEKTGNVDEIKLNAGRIRFPDGSLVDVSDTIDVLGNTPSQQPTHLYITPRGYEPYANDQEQPTDGYEVAQVTCIGDDNPTIVDLRALVHFLKYDTDTLDVDATTKKLKVKDNTFDADGAASGAVGTHESSYDHSELHTHSNKATLDNIEEALTTALKGAYDGAVSDSHTHSNKTELDKVTDGDHDVRTDNPHSVTKTQAGLGNVEDLKVKLDATSAPGATNDSTEGYAVGSRWIDVTADKEYVCLDATEDNAVWTETTQSGGGSASRQSFDNDDLAAGILTVTDNAGLSAPYSRIVQVYDNNNKLIQPDEITGAANSFTIDLSSFGAITGTWEVIYLV